MELHNDFTALATRRIFPAWAICYPVDFQETFDSRSGYWHAWDQERSISLTSVALASRVDHRSITEVEGLEQIQAAAPELLVGEPFEEMPPGLHGRAAIGAAVQPARASMALIGMLAVPGRILIATITSDDLDWVRFTWRSIRHLDAPLQSRRVPGGSASDEAGGGALLESQRDLAAFPAT
jgi:hypothetical protein